MHSNDFFCTFAVAVANTMKTIHVEKKEWWQLSTRAVCAVVAVGLLAGIYGWIHGGRSRQSEQSFVQDEQPRQEDKTEVRYRGRTFSYKHKFNDLNARHLKAARKLGLNTAPQTREAARGMKGQLRKVETNGYYVVEELTHSVPYLVPTAAARLDSIGAEFADILARNGLPHYRFRVTSVFRTGEDIKRLQKSGNINSVSESAHNYATTFDIAYTKFDKVTNTSEYMTDDNLKLVLGQALLNQQRRGNIYVKYEWQQCCFHITARK